MHQKRTRDIRHSLDITDIRSEDGEGGEDVLERLIKFLPVAEVTKVDESAMQVLFDHFDVLLEGDVILNVVLC